MKLELEQVDSIVVVHPQGDFDNEGVREVQDGLAEHLAKDDPKIIVDLSGTSRVTSAALRLFVSLSKQLDSRGGGFALCGPKNDVARALLVGGLERVCKVVPDLNEALEWLRIDDRLDRLARLVVDLLARADDRRRLAEAG
jgi:anti-anti-sigma factor